MYQFISQKVANMALVARGGIVGERYDGQNRSNVDRARPPRASTFKPRSSYPKSADRLGHVLEITITKVFNLRIEPDRELITSVGGNHDFTRVSNGQEASSDVDAVAIDIAGASQNLAEVYANSKL